MYEKIVQLIPEKYRTFKLLFNNLIDGLLQITIERGKALCYACLHNKNPRWYMTKEVIKHRKEQKKKPTMTDKEKKAKKQEKKQKKGSSS